MSAFWCLIGHDIYFNSESLVRAKIVFWFPARGYGFAEADIDGEKIKIYVHIGDHRSVTVVKRRARAYFLWPGKECLPDITIGQEIFFVPSRDSEGEGYRALCWCLAERFFASKHWISRLLDLKKHGAELVVAADWSDQDGSVIIEPSLTGAGGT